MRLEGLDDVLNDAALTGRVSRMSVKQTTIKRARPLLLNEVRRLEMFMTEQCDVFDKYMVGCILVAIYSRSRWSDLAMLDNLSVDVSDVPGGTYGFVDGPHGARRLAPLLLRRRCKCRWLHQLFEVMDSIQFDYSKSPVAALCRAPTTDGLTTRSMSSAEVSDFINSLLGLTGDDAITSHSMQATTLSWCAKYGIDETSRTLLGHHELQAKSMSCYSRDLLSRPLYAYQRIKQCFSTFRKE